MSIVKKYFSWGWTLALILSTSSCDEVEVCDGIKNIKTPTLELTFKQTENSKFDLSNLLFFKDGNPISLNIKDSKVILDLNFPETQNLVEIKYKEKITNPDTEDTYEEIDLARIKIDTKPYYISLACGFALAIKEEGLFFSSKSPKIQIGETKEDEKNTAKKTDKENAKKIRLKLGLDIIFPSS